MFQICSGRVTLAGIPPGPPRKALILAPMLGQSLGAPNLAFSTLVGECGTPVIIQ